MRFRFIVALTLITLLPGCRMIYQYDAMREQHDRAELIGRYRSCVDAGALDCDQITAGLNSGSLYLHRTVGPIE